MKKTLIYWSVIAISLLACTFASTPMPLGNNVPTIAVAVETATMNAPTTVSSGIPVSFENVSFVIPSGLASGAIPQLVPVADESNSDPWSVAPQHILFTLTDYSAPISSFEAMVRVYPAQEYAAVNSWAEGSLTRLQAILANPGQPLTNDNLSTVPFNGAAAQQYAAQVELISFNGGNGVRMISQYAQFPGPITKDNSFYHFEGLTSDGKYLVAVLLPVSLPLQSTADNPSADGILFPDPGSSDAATMNAYYQAITDKLNAASPESFTPTLSQLDALIQFIRVTSE